MIRNERQYRTTKTQIEKFARALADAEGRTAGDPLLRKLESDALRGQLQDLERDVREYERLRSGRCGVIRVDSFEELPRALVQARIAAGLSQKELADRLGMKEQQVQRYEATDYQAASLAKLQQVVKALGVEVREDLFLPTAIKSPEALFDRLATAGVDKAFVVRRLLPPALASRMNSAAAADRELSVREAADTVGRVFRWSPDELFGTRPLRLHTEPAGIARFKLPARANDRRLSAYTVYAHYLSLLVLQSTPGLRPKPVPVDAAECRAAVVAAYGAVTFANVLRFVWELGIPVVPLSDPGAFHGASWRVGGRNVIVLKQRYATLATWLHDLLHELFHAGQEPDQAERSVIEESEMSPERRESEEEQSASLYAGDVMLDGRAEDLAQRCVQAAGGRVERLKAVVPQVAGKAGVEVGALANYMAFRLSLQDINWWGAATNLQKGEGDPCGVARAFLAERLALDRLNDIDRRLVLQALSHTTE
jgi:transcriptional regulator with XRE-family HTH domain